MTHESGRASGALEDTDLLLGRGRFADDLPVPPARYTPRSCARPMPHAELRAIDAAGALALPGVECVVTGEDARSYCS